jgi:hypothetical protein
MPVETPEELENTVRHDLYKHMLATKNRYIETISNAANLQTEEAWKVLRKVGNEVDLRLRQIEGTLPAETDVEYVAEYMAEGM